MPAISLGLHNIINVGFVLPAKCELVPTWEAIACVLLECPFTRIINEGRTNLKFNGAFPGTTVTEK